MTDRKKYRKYAIIAGVVLAIVCHFVPVEYKTACNAIVAACRQGF